MSRVSSVVLLALLLGASGEHNDLEEAAGYIGIYGSCNWALFDEFDDYMIGPWSFNTAPVGFVDCATTYDSSKCVTIQECRSYCSKTVDCTGYETALDNSYCSLWFSKCTGETDSEFGKNPLEFVVEPGVLPAGTGQIAAATYIALGSYTGSMTHSSGATGDPHLAFADGGVADFKGDDDTIYNLLTAKNISINVLFRYADFNLPGPRHKLVHGSFMRECYIAIRSSLTGRLLHIEFHAATPKSATVVYADGRDEPVTVTAESTFRLEDVEVELGNRSLCIGTGRWGFCAESKVYQGLTRGTSCADGRCILDVRFKSRYDVARDRVAPHGLVGQSYDGDGIARNGAVDDYSNPDEVVTSAQAEGAIQGTGSDYKMSGKFSTEYTFSRFSADSALPRNASMSLGGSVRASVAPPNQVGRTSATS